MILRILFRVVKYLLIFIIAVVFLDAAIVYGVAHYRPEIKKSDAIIIMGAAINTPALKNRTLEALHLYEQGKASVIVLAGGKISDADISEAQYMEKIIKLNAQDKQSLPVMILEQSSRNTYENIRNAKEKVPDAKSVIVVSDEFHLARSALTAKALGFESVSWAAPRPDYYSPPELRRYYFREMAALITYVPKLIAE